MANKLLRHGSRDLQPSAKNLGSSSDHRMPILGGVQVEHVGMRFAGWRVDKQVDSCVLLAEYDWRIVLPGDLPLAACASVVSLQVGTLLML